MKKCFDCNLIYPDVDKVCMRCGKTLSNTSEVPIEESVARKTQAPASSDGSQDMDFWMGKTKSTSESKPPSPVQPDDSDDEIAIGVEKAPMSFPISTYHLKYVLWGGFFLLLIGGGYFGLAYMSESLETEAGKAAVARQNKIDMMQSITQLVQRAQTEKDPKKREILYKKLFSLARKNLNPAQKQLLDQSLAMLKQASPRQADTLRLDAEYKRLRTEVTKLRRNKNEERAQKVAIEIKTLLDKYNSVLSEKVGTTSDGEAITRAEFDFLLRANLEKVAKLLEKLTGKNK